MIRSNERTSSLDLNSLEKELADVNEKLAPKYEERTRLEQEGVHKNTHELNKEIIVLEKTQIILINQIAKLMIRNNETSNLSESESLLDDSHRATPTDSNEPESKLSPTDSNKPESKSSPTDSNEPESKSSPTDSNEPESKLSPTDSTQHHKGNKMSAKNIIIASSILLIIAGLVIGLPGFVPALSFMMIGGLLPKSAALLGIILAATGVGIFGGYSLVSNDESRESSSESVDSDFDRVSLTV